MDERAQRARAALAAAEAAARSGIPQPSPSRGPVEPRQPTDRTRATQPDAVTDPYAFARAIALRQLAVAPRSRSELERKLAAKGCPDEVAAVVLDRLTEVGLLDDAAYAAMLVRSKQSSRGLARSALARELATKGVDRDVASDALEEIDDGAERARAEDLVAKRLRTMTGLPADVQARRLSAMLARKGYPGGLAYAVIRSAISELPEHQRD